MPRPWHLILAATLCVTIILECLAYFAAPGSFPRLVLTPAAVVVAVVFSLVAVAWSCRYFPTARERKGWLLMSAALMMMSLGDCLWTYYVLVQHRLNPFPSWADLLYVLAYIPLWMGLLVQPGTRPRDLFSRLSTLLEMLITILTALILIWVLSIGPALEATDHMGPLAKALAVMYPVLSAATLLCVINLIFHRAFPVMRLPRLVLLAGTVVLCLEQMVYSYQQYHRNYQAGTWSDSFWMVTYLSLGIAALLTAGVYQRHGNIRGPMPAPPTRLRVVIPHLLVLASSILLLVRFLPQAHHPSTADKVLLSGTVAVFFLVLLRQWLIFTENRRLTLELHLAYLEASQQAIIDPITELPNRRYLMKRLESEIARCDRYGDPLALLFADVDLFKMINDTHGHLAGDSVLHRVAATLQSAIRTSDILVRFAGEEFIVLLPGTTLAQAKALAERMRIAIEALHIPLENGHIVHVTVSIGLSAYPVPSAGLETLIADADAAMYRIKRSGRNGVLAANEESLTLPLSPT